MRHFPTVLLALSIAACHLDSNGDGATNGGRGFSVDAGGRLLPQEPELGVRDAQSEVPSVLGDDAGDEASDVAVSDLLPSYPPGIPASPLSPVDGATPPSKCEAVTCSGAHVMCDPADGKCKLDGTTTHVGAACAKRGADPKCGSESQMACYDDKTDEFPGGYCSMEPCSETVLCPVGSSCARLSGEPAACFQNCTTDAACRSPEYKCQDIKGLNTSGASSKVCYRVTLYCKSNADCPESRPKCGLRGAAADGTCG